MKNHFTLFQFSCSTAPSLKRLFIVQFSDRLQRFAHGGKDIAGLHFVILETWSETDFFSTDRVGASCRDLTQAP